MPRPLTLALLLLVATSAAAKDSPVLLLPRGLGRSDVVWVSGRVLEEEHRKHGPKPYRTARALAASNLVGAAVEVRFLGRSAHAVSGQDGEFEVAIRPADGEAFPAGLQEAAVQVEGVTATVKVQVVPPDAPFLLVSDFDDTVAVSNVTSTPDVLATTFLKDAETHPAVPGMAAFYRCLHEGGAPVAFVSGSPLQLAPRVTRFLERNGFPPAALFLRNLGRKTLHGYKEPVLEKLAERPVEPARSAGAFLFRDPGKAAREAVARGLAGEACVAEAFPPPPVR